ncbi:Spy/CpxP family protein refolding chaperone [Dyella sp. C11]|uniref:Spy/CpxP family protein refolding chaperone n=1 Tax=Dyella sp. C11 TaxID=2126991 RepID=UPI000D65AEA7|nr:Spy/CpxP family protein refolding chaperone [Dyella sp. C11]
MKTTLRSLTLPALIAFALAAGPAMAQQGTPETAPPAAAAQKPPTTTPKSAQDHGQKHADAVEQRIADLHAQLKITDQQSKQWDAFAQTMRDNARKADEAFRERAQKLPTMSAPDAMKSYADLTETHADNMKKLSSSFSDLYDVLSPDQKQIADAMYRGKAPGAPRKGKSSSTAVSSATH